MCGILSVVNFRQQLTGKHLVAASSVIRHRGPDDEGFLTWMPGEKPVIWAGNDTAASTRSHWGYQQLPDGQPFSVGFGHRRLSILDLSPAGHQPMAFEEAGLVITFNGEVYNYLEIKAELEQRGHSFHTSCDTEVILHAWKEWGPDCLHKFNGMFAFALLDYNNRRLHVVRDRFGVKPVYYLHGASALYIGSEIKQLRTSPDYRLDVDDKIVRQFLAAGAAEHTNETFDKQIKHLPGGHYMRIDLARRDHYDIVKWYTLQPKSWSGSFDAAADQLRELLTDAVRLRLRSDVTVGSCLSGGLDSSSIVCIAAELLKAGGSNVGQETVTACYDNARYDEWQFAQEVIRATNAHPHRTFPSFTQLRDEVDRFMWHQDEPVASTSVFSQWAVFKATNEAGLKVMIDGQGADEQLAGYGGNDLPLYSGLLRRAKFGALLSEALSYKKEKGTWPKSFLLGAYRLNVAKFPPPARVSWLKGGEPQTIFDKPATSLQENLLRQLYGEPLPGLLRYEDHNSMAWSVESRTPFMDYRLLELTLGLPDRYVYRNGVRKAVLRKAMHKVIPTAIEQRKDKMGFVTPEELWLKGEGREWFTAAIEDTFCQLPHIFDVPAARAHVQRIIEGQEQFTFVPWRIASLGMWYRQVYGK